MTLSNEDLAEVSKIVHEEIIKAFQVLQDNSRSVLHYDEYQVPDLEHVMYGALAELERKYQENGEDHEG